MISTAIRSAAPQVFRRNFATTLARRDVAAVPTAPTKRPVGAFRGGLFGFFLGSTVAGGLAYYYIYDEYKLANELLTEDINALRATIARVDVHVRDLEEKIADQAAALAKRK